MIATYRPIVQTDIEILVAMMKDFYAIDGYPMDEMAAAELFLEFISNETLGKAWMIIVDDTFIGYVILTFVFSFEYKGRIAFWMNSMLTAVCAAKGIGKTTIKFVQSQLSVLGLKLIYLEVEAHNHNAQKLYLASGFEAHNRKILKYINTNP